MAKLVKVTPAQVQAARLKVERSRAKGKPVSASVTAIANARKANTSQTAPPAGSAIPS
ncbi:hypothetical protein SAMN06264364_12285 [Quadrisphaera granulorum]|uniref:Uncharacterized protein n=1 Tax=Quadrisphaera granulorum TaxID=317664 RepID=A0A315ZZK3_9ACTN|nr:hypothetical protein BXY45_12285 [Quadrisphaera granulorum]SZE97957.1 hypothetical protein SAMN06264364_12285 [Quadrisphaera granulorum]